MTLSTEIDRAISLQYQGASGFGELAQLRRLFSPAFVSDLQQALAADQAKGAVTVTLGWIDKRPYADMTVSGTKDAHQNPITRPVELGDAAIFVMEVTRLKDQTIRSRIRGLIVQAKAAPTASLPKVPVTALSPSHPNCSTNKELALLSNWPKFDLYLANGRRGPILDTFTLPKCSSPPSYGWYAAAPGSRSSGWDTSGYWRSRWMCAPAVKGHLCDSTLGEVIEALFKRSSIDKVPVGADCTMTYSVYQIGAPPILPNVTEWDRLCATLVQLTANNRQATAGPPGLFVSFPYMPGLTAMVGAAFRKLIGFFKETCFPVIIIEREWLG
jgi:hypothetical protein